ncbi:MAG TPA: sigma-70 family RNA polymerase sigma factor, partial [Pirellulales bacterium]|nr:sigma-70 family RNA polymerase sigma factor [Pirellulales bacterium]
HMSSPAEEPANSPAEAAPPDGRVDAYVRLLSQNQRRVTLYVLSLVPRWNDAEEIIQETNLVLWREFDQFELGTNFAAWACKVAFHQVLAWQKRRGRDRLRFTPEFLEAVAGDAAAAADRLEQRGRLLDGCIRKLPDGQRELLRLRYIENRSIDEVAQQVDRTATAVYRALSRIRQVLHECVTRSLAQEA